MTNEKEPTKDELWQEGYRSALRGAKRWRYPQKYYKDGNDSHLQWIAGWDAANESLSDTKINRFESLNKVEL